MLAFTKGRFLLVAIYLLETWMIDGALAFRILPKSDDTPPLKQQNDELRSDLAAFVRSSSLQKPAIYSQALSLLDSMQNAPSCNRLAASTLLDSCQSVEGSTTGAGSSLEDFRSIYAARLAMCEIVSAGSAIPSHCKHFQHGNGNVRHRVHSDVGGVGRNKQMAANDVDSRHLSQCLQSLESRPQWWTSYSNSRQNAVVMCQAVRAEVEKDDLIRLHKSMSQTSSEVHSALSKALQQANENLSQQAGFAAAVRTFQEQLLHDLGEAHNEAQSYFAKVVQSMETMTQGVVNRLSTAIGTVEIDIAGLNANLRQSKTEAADLQKNVVKMFQEMVEGSSELAASQMGQWEQTKDVASRLQESLGSMREVEVNALLNAFGGIHGELQKSNKLVSQMYLRQNELDQRLVHLDKSFIGLENKAEAFDAAQNRQAESQTRLYDQMQTEMYVARGLLADVTSSAASLQTTLEDTSFRVADMAASGAFNSFLRWGWLALVLFGLYLFNPRYAGLAAAALGLGLFVLLRASSIPSHFAGLPNDIILIHYASGFQISLALLLRVLSFLSFPVLAVLSYRLSARFRVFCAKVVTVANNLVLQRSPHPSKLSTLDI